MILEKIRFVSQKAVKELCGPPYQGGVARCEFEFECQKQAGKSQKNLSEMSQ